MGVPGFYSWLTRRYPLIKHMLGRKQIPKIDYLYLDMNGIIYKCVKDESIIFKSQILPKELEEIWIEVFNYIDMIVNLLKPEKMLFMGLDGVAPRSKMNNQRARRFKSAKDYKQYMENFYGFNENVDSQENFKNNSISPGTKFMDELNKMLKFFIQKKIEQDEQWRHFSVVFTGSDCPGEGQHKIMEFMRANQHQFSPDDNHCLYGADADLIMLGLTLPIKNVLIIREEFIRSVGGVSIVATRQSKAVQFEIIFLTILREYFEIEYEAIRNSMQNVVFDITRIINDFVFLFFFIGNDFLPRCMTYNIRKTSIEKLISAFKNYLLIAEDYVVGKDSINLGELAKLTGQLAKFESIFIQEKSQDGQKFLREKQKFEDELSNQLKQKVKKETEFLLQMKHLYQNQDGSERKLFYETKFKVDPVQNVQEFYKILSFYMYGLNFVYQYYFVNLPSWSWYYPYYYAPLIGDLSFYLNYLATNDYKLEPIELGNPFHPFKQLLCILPRQSAELLPKAFAQQLLNPESALRSPIDYYPDEFQSDMYGSTIEYEAISLIPFLNHQMIDHIYDKNIQKVSPQDMRRNKACLSQLFEFDALAGQIAVQSPFPNIERFRCQITMKEVELRKEFKWASLSHHRQKTSLYRMPSLKVKQIEALAKENKRGNFSYVLRVMQPDVAEVKMGQQIFYGYPLQHSGEVQAVLTKKQFKYVDKFEPRNYCSSLDMQKALTLESMKQHNKKHIFEYTLGCLKQAERYPDLNLELCENLVFVADTQCFVRTLSGKFMRSFQQNNTKSYEIVPGSFISKQKFYETTKDNVSFESLEEEFALQEEVLILNHPKYTGSSAKVKGYNKEQNKIKIHIVKELKPLKQQTIQQIANTDEVFFTLRFASELVDTRPDILLTLIDSVPVVPPKQHKNLPSSIDIGMNFISRRNCQLVPNLVRINYHERQTIQLPENKVFMKLQLSIRAVELIVEYKKNYSDVFDFIKDRHERLIREAKEDGNKIQWKEEMEASQIFKNQQEATKSLMKVYLWLIKKEETHMPLSSIYSKQISKRKITKLQELFKERNVQIQNKKNKKVAELREIEIDPNYLFSRRLASFGLVHLSQKPPNHFIGDGVICLKREHFGQYGVVIGIDDQKYEVLFEKPSFGKIDLKGLCDNLWGGKFNFRDLFNIGGWPQYVEERKRAKRIVEEIGWMQSREPFLPKFKSNPLKNFNDVELLSKVIPEEFFNYIMEVKKNLKQVDVDPDYIINDNKRQDHYYKYNQNVPTIQQKQAKDMKRNIKYMEKPIQPSEVLQQESGKNFEPEVIQNKVQDEENVPKKVESKPKPYESKPHQEQDQAKKTKYKEKPKYIEKPVEKKEQIQQGLADVEEGVKRIQIAEEQEQADDIMG